LAAGLMTLGILKIGLGGNAYADNGYFLDAVLGHGEREFEVEDE
jgi:hypothetical protein